MTERAPEKKKSLKDQAQELLQGVADALESLLPQPELLPVPVVVKPAPHRRRRR
jgi:hypothetical protein